MVVNSHNIEFGYELLSAVPYALQTRPGMGKRKDNNILNSKSMKTIRMISTGKIKRIDDQLAKEVVVLGEAEYIHDIVDSINKPAEIKKEVKVVNPVEETKPHETDVDTVELESRDVIVKKRGRKTKK